MRAHRGTFNQHNMLRDSRSSASPWLANEPSVRSLLVGGCWLLRCWCCSRPMGQLVLLPLVDAAAVTITPSAFGGAYAPPADQRACHWLLEACLTARHVRRWPYGQRRTR